MEEKKFTRKCPLCQKDIHHKNERVCNDSRRLEKPCISCAKLAASNKITWKRNCKTCNKEIIYQSKHSYECNKTHMCRACSRKEIGKQFAGSNNPFYGKTHTPEAIEKIKARDTSYLHTEEFKQQARENLAKVTNKRPLYEIWLEKYGKEEADKRLAIFKEKQSKNNSGSGNPMYGKPSPQGAGNGWSGWYKGWYFRSLRELTYMINVVEANNLKWRTAETADLQIKYTFFGKDRTYNADFLIDEKILVECKPQKLHNTPNVLAKQQAAIEFCKQRGYEYLLVDPGILPDETIRQMIENKTITLITSYQDRYNHQHIL